MKVSFITTVLNEEKSIIDFLDSIRYQTKKFDEVIIVDAGSTDKTFNMIKSYKSIPVKLFRKKGNRSIGRNFAIKKSQNSIIAVSDAGCILDKNWNLRLSKPFENPKIDVVAGFYYPVTHNVFEKSLATYTCYPEDKLNKDFLPSSRSIAFRIDAWEKVCGYPENLDTCEDLIYARNLKKENFRFKVVKSAYVLWPQRENLYDAAIQFFSYAKGDGKALYFRPQTPFLFLRYIFVLYLFYLFITSQNFLIIYTAFILFSLYSIWAILKNYDYVNKFGAIFYLPILQIVSDIMVMTGFIIGIFLRVWDTKK